MRREAILLEVEDHASRKLLETAAAAQVLDKSLDSLSGRAVQSARSTAQVEREVDGLGKTSRRSGADINQLSGRLSILARVFATLGPAIAPVGAVGVAGVAGLASVFGLASVGALSLLAAAQGVGDALKAVEKARLEPTVENIAKAEEAMSRLAPEAREFVARFQELRPILGELRNAAAKGWFPGLTSALDSLETAAPRLERILLAASTAGGDAVAAGANSLAGERWADFLQFVEDEAPSAIADVSKAIGSLTHGLAELWIAMDPVSDGARGWLTDVAASFDNWASNLQGSEGLQEFFDYVNANGPKVAEAASAISSAVLQIAEAAAPLGGPVLEDITALATAIATIADSPLGTPLFAMASAMSVARLASDGLSKSLTRTKLSADQVAVATRGVGPAAAAVSFAIPIIRDLNAQLLSGQKIASGNANRDIISSVLGTDPSAIEDFISQVNLLKGAGGGLREASAEIMTGYGLFGDTIGDKATKNIKEIDVALASMVEAGQSVEAGKFVDRLRSGFEDLGWSVNDLNSYLPQYEQATRNSAASTAAAANATGQLELKQQQAKLALQESRKAAIEAGRAFLDFSDSIAGDRFSLSKWLDTFEDQVRALANWQVNLQKLRGKGLNNFALNELTKQGPAAAQAVEALANAGQDSIGRLNRATRTARGELRQVGRDAATARGEVQGLGDAKAQPFVDLVTGRFDSKRDSVVGGIRSLGNMQAEPKVDVDKSRADAGLRRFRFDLNRVDGASIRPQVSLSGIGPAEAALARLTRDRTVNVITRTLFFGAKLGQSADGSTVPKDGGPYADRYPYLLAPGEEVISNRRGQADRHRPLLKAINAGMLADGGTARGAAGMTFQTASGVSGLEYARQTRDAAKAVKDLAKSAKALNKQLDKATSRRDSLLSARSDLTGAVSSGLTSDLWGSGEWSNSDPMSILRADIARARQFNVDRARLYSKGLRGSALEDILRAGAEDPTKIRELAGMSAAQIRQYQSLFNQRAQLVGSVSRSAGGAVYDARLITITRELREIQKALKANTNSRKSEHDKDRRENRNSSARAARSRDRGTVKGK